MNQKHHDRKMTEGKQRAEETIRRIREQVEKERNEVENVQHVQQEST